MITKSYFYELWQFAIMVIGTTVLPEIGFLNIYVVKYPEGLRRLVDTILATMHFWNGNYHSYDAYRPWIIL